MNIIQRRIRPFRDVPQSVYEERRLREVAQERCAVCTFLWPSSMMSTEDGRRVCPDDVDITTNEWKTEQDAIESDLKVRHQTPPQVNLGGAPLHETAVPWIRKMETAVGVRVTQNAPLGLVRSDDLLPPTAQLIITGGGFASTDTFTYSTGITDSVAPVLTGTTIWTLTLTAALATSPGNNNLAYNGHQYRGILRAG